MIEAVNCTTLSVALEKLKQIIKNSEKLGKRTVIFCEDRLSLAAERTVCSAVGGTFLSSVFTFARFLSDEYGRGDNVLSAQGSAMAVRRIMEENKESLIVFKKMTAGTAAQSVYDTIALLYSSRVSPEDAYKASAAGGMLGGKLKDIALIYSEYQKYLEESGREDRNGYLKKLAQVVENSQRIRGNRVVFLGFQAFTHTALECVRAAFAVAESVSGLFIGGTEDIYVNEASASFIAAAEEFGGACVSSEHGELTPEAERLRTMLFNPESFFKPGEKTSRVHIFEAADGEEELEFIAATIKKHVIDEGERYAKISVMLPDIASCEGALSRVFAKYRIPYYADRRIPLSEHPLCTFIFGWLSCIISGCRPQDVDGIIASPLFPAERKDKDVFRNYALRLANFRGGVRRVPDRQILEAMKFDYDAVERVRQTFLKGLAQFGGKSVFDGLREILLLYRAEEKLAELSEKFRNDYPVAAAFGARAYGGVIAVLNEAESLTERGTPLNEIVKILKSGFAATEISLIPPKSDAVFVGDLSATANTGSNVVFAAGLTGDVPGASADTSLLTDREITLLEGVNLNISPKIRQVNARRRELAALNICSFRNHLYLTYPTRSGGEEKGASEIISYCSQIFLSPSSSSEAESKHLAAINLKRIERTGRAVPFYCSEKLPAINQLLRSDARPEVLSAVYEVLCRHGFKEEADAALKEPEQKSVSCGRQLYMSYDSISPTALETYFSCPYLGYMRQGLKVREREEGVVRAIDTGNFIHAVLENLAPELNDIQSGDELKARAREIAENLLKKPPYSSLYDIKSGEYTAGELKKEAVAVSAGMYEQVKNSRFSVSSAERKCEIYIAPNVKIYGRVDRVDECGDMVRIIDYKTGTIDCAPSKYYTGLKLQLPLYLLAVSEGKRAAGAYYFPAAVEYKERADGIFRLQGYMDGSEEVVSASDTTLQPKQKSEFFDAYLNGRKLDAAMDSEDFEPFLGYSKLVAKKGAEEMLSGNISPSPAADVCKYCKMGGSCGFAAGKDGAERKTPSVKCADIAAIVRKEEGKDA